MIQFVSNLCCVCSGCGGYADNAVGAMCTTGTGEAFIRIAAAKHMACLIQTGSTISQTYYFVTNIQY